MLKLYYFKLLAFENRIVKNRSKRIVIVLDRIGSEFNLHIILKTKSNSPNMIELTDPNKYK